eukprot:GSChrysophyteH1.ASY1.ANO1.957.1 assembled CDS
MGIKDLLLSINGAVEDKHITDFKGSRVAIDASGWLHKGLYGAAEEFVDSNFEDAQLYVDFILMRVRTLLQNNVEPVVVFDGKRSTLKNETQEKRGDVRKSSIDQGRRLLESMRKVTDPATKAKLRQEAVSNFQRGLSVTTEMEKSTIGALRKMGVRVVVAPYEADSQLAYLCHTGYTQAVLTEDSDVLVYSAICGTPFPILYKFDKTGSVRSVNCQRIMPELHSASGVPPARRRMFAQMCILAGCDYLDSIPGVGLATALQAVVRCRDGPCDGRFERVCRLFKQLNKKVPETYLLRARKAESLFHYHPVFDLDICEVVPFMPFNEGALATPFPGLTMDVDSLPKEPKILSEQKIRSPTRRSPRKHKRSRSDSIESIDEDEGEDDFLKSKSSLVDNAKKYVKLEIEIPPPTAEFLPPAISPTDQEQLGCLHGGRDLLRNASSSVTLTDLCLGVVSCKDFQPIRSFYPWDHAKFAKPPQSRCKGGYWPSSWSTRRILMQAEQSKGGLSVRTTMSAGIRAMNIRSIQLQGKRSADDSKNGKVSERSSGDGRHEFLPDPEVGLFSFGFQEASSRTTGVPQVNPVSLPSSGTTESTEVNFDLTDLSYISGDESQRSGVTSFDYNVEGHHSEEDASKGCATETPGKIAPLEKIPQSTDVLDKALATPSTGRSIATVSTESTVPTPEIPLDRIVDVDVSPSESEVASRPFNPFKKNLDDNSLVLAERMVEDSYTVSSPVISASRSPSSVISHAGTCSSPPQPRIDRSVLDAEGVVSAVSAAISTSHGEGTGKVSDSNIINRSPPTMLLNLSPLRNITNNNSHIITDLTRERKSAQPKENFIHAEQRKSISTSSDRRNVVVVTSKPAKSRGRSTLGAKSSMKMASISSFFKAQK